MAKIVKVRVDQAWPQQWPQDIIVEHLLPIVVSRLRLRDIQAFACTCRQFWDWSSEWHKSISLESGFMSSAENNLRITVRVTKLQDDRKRLLACAAMRKAPRPPEHMAALCVIKDIADRSERDEDCALLQSFWPGDECLAIATVVAFPQVEDADKRATNLLKDTLDGLAPGPALDKLALMLPGLVRKMRIADKAIIQSLMRKLDLICPSSQVAVLSALGMAGLARESVRTGMAVLRDRLLDGTLLAHSRANVCLYWAYTNARQLLQSDAPLWLGKEMIERLGPHMLQLERPRAWTADSGWVLQLLSAARRLYRDDRDELMRVFSSVGEVLKAGGWRYMSPEEFTTYCEALQSAEMTGQFHWMLQNAPRGEERKSRGQNRCIIS